MSNQVGYSIAASGPATTCGSRKKSPSPGLKVEWPFQSALLWLCLFQGKRGLQGQWARPLGPHGTPTRMCSMYLKPAVLHPNVPNPMVSWYLHGTVRAHPSERALCCWYASLRHRTPGLSLHGSVDGAWLCWGKDLAGQEDQRGEFSVPHHLPAQGSDHSQHQPGLPIVMKVHG